MTFSRTRLDGLEARRVKASLADCKQPLDDELHALVDLALMQHCTESLEDAANTQPREVVEIRIWG